MRASLLLLPLFGLLTLAAPARAQTPGSAFGFATGSVAKLVRGATDTLAYTWAGGLNAPQFSSIDLDQDGRADLYAFDRQTRRGYTFLNAPDPAGAPGSRRWRYAPQYEALFPGGLSGWVLLRDYDCDGRADLFTLSATGGDIRVFRNAVGDGGRPRFVPVTEALTFPINNGFVASISPGVYNIPAIQDVNGDGRLDVLTYDFLGSTQLELYLNASTGACGGIATFTQSTNYWGQALACASDCGAFSLVGAPACQVYKPAHSAGHSVLLLDLNGDGKLDLLDGRDNCPQLTRLLNAGSSSVAAQLTAAGASSAFPSAAAPVNVPVFTAAYSLDADFDGVPDLLVAPALSDNALDRVSMRQSVRLYRNAAASAGAAPQFSLADDGFLQGRMLDVSEAAAPAFGDLSGDGLPDMLVGSGGDLVGGRYRGSLSYYRNVGTAARPVLRLETDDYLGLAAAAVAAGAPGPPGTHFEALRPALTDLNRDGAPDLVYSFYDGASIRTAYLLNLAPAGQPARFEPAQVRYLLLPGIADQPVSVATNVGNSLCFFDVDNDGYVDLLLGTNVGGLQAGNGSLRYFRHRGSGNPGPNFDNAFALADADFGRLRAGSGSSNPPNLSAAVADFDGDGRPDLLTADGRGTVTLYADLRAQPSAFLGRTELFFNDFTGTYEPARLGQGFILRFALATADLNADNVPELYVGTEAGGVQSFLGGRGRTVLATAPPVAAAADLLALRLYPNPASSGVTVETARPSRLRLYDLAGRAVRESSAELLRRQTLDVQGLAPGLYLVRATAADGRTAVARLAVR